MKLQPIEVGILGVAGLVLFCLFARLDLRGGYGYVNVTNEFMTELRVDENYPEKFIAEDNPAFPELKALLDKIRPDLKDRKVRGVTHARGSLFYALVQTPEGDPGGYVMVSEMGRFERELERERAERFWR